LVFGKICTRGKPWSRANGSCWPLRNAHWSLALEDVLLAKGIGVCSRICRIGFVLQFPPDLPLLDFDKRASSSDGAFWLSRKKRNSSPPRAVEIVEAASCNSTKQAVSRKAESSFLSRRRRRPDKRVGNVFSMRPMWGF